MKGSSLCQSLKPLECVVDKDPILVRLPCVIIGWSSWKIIEVRKSVCLSQFLCFNTYFQGHIWEVIKVRCIINRSNLNWYSCWSLSDMIPIYSFEPVYVLDVIKTLDSLFSFITKSKTWYSTMKSLLLAAQNSSWEIDNKLTLF